MRSIVFIACSFLLTLGICIAQETTATYRATAQMFGAANTSRTTNLFAGSKPLATAASEAPNSSPARLSSPDDDLGNVCYKMRTYVVARDSREDDVVRPVKYFTCLPGSKVAMKSADTGFGPSRR
jgi:hypothetical protein